MCAAGGPDADAAGAGGTDKDADIAETGPGVSAGAVAGDGVVAGDGGGARAGRGKVSMDGVQCIASQAVVPVVGAKFNGNENCEFCLMLSDIRTRSC